MADYLIDTNHASGLMALQEPLTTRAQQARVRGDRLGLSITVLGELYYAVYASRRQELDLRYLRQMLDTLMLFPFDEPAAEEFGRIRAEQKAAGCPIPPLDAQIAAVARLHDLVLLTADHHFQFVAGLSVENWQRA